MNFDYCNGMTYVVRQGDTLYSLSRRYNVPLALILRANPYVDIYNLQIGDQICIPMEPAVPPCWSCPAAPGEGPVPLPTPGVDGDMNQPAAPGEGPVPLPMPGVNGDMNQPAAPGEGPVPLPTPGVNGDMNQPAAPGEGPVPLPMPGVDGDMNQPAMPGEGPVPLPTPGVNGDMNQPAAPGEGPVPLPMPGVSGGFPSYQLITYVIRGNDTLQKILDYFNISLADLLRCNQLGSIVLMPGMTIQIPKRADD